MFDVTVGFSGIAEAMNGLTNLHLAAQVFGASSASIRSDDPVATFVEMGTRAHDIYPRDKKALFWEGARHPVSGHVHHPETAANPFMERGRDAASRPIEALVASEFDQVASGGGSNYTTIMDHAGALLLAAIQKEAPVGPSTPTRAGGTLRRSLYYVNGR